MGKKKGKKIKFVKGTATQQLSELIPIENIKVYFSLYQIIKDTDFLTSLHSYNIKEKQKLIMRDFKSYFDKVIPDLKKSYLEVQGKDIPKIEKIIENDPLRQIFENRAREILKHDFLEGAAKRILRKRRPTDYAFNILIQALHYDLIYYKNKPYHKVLADFLTEQRIKQCDYAHIGIYVRRLKKLPIREYLLMINALTINEQKHTSLIGDACELAGVNGLHSGFLTFLFPPPLTL